MELAEKIGVDPTNNESLQSHEVKGYILKQVKKLCKAFPAYAVPKNVALHFRTMDNREGVADTNFEA